MEGEIWYRIRDDGEDYVMILMNLIQTMMTKRTLIRKGSMPTAMSLTIKKIEFCFSRGSRPTLDCCQKLTLYFSHMPFFRPPKNVVIVSIEYVINIDGMASSLYFLFLVFIYMVDWCCCHHLFHLKLWSSLASCSSTVGERPKDSWVCKCTTTFTREKVDSFAL